MPKENFSILYLPWQMPGLLEFELKIHPFFRALLIASSSRQKKILPYAERKLLISLLMVFDQRSSLPAKYTSNLEQIKAFIVMLYVLWKERVFRGAIQKPITNISSGADS